VEIGMNACGISSLCMHAGVSIPHHVDENPLWWGKITPLYALRTNCCFTFPVPCLTTAVMSSSAPGTSRSRVHRV
jgi:hypothetical protein